MTDISKEREPDYWAVFAPSGTHVGLWEDEEHARRECGPGYSRVALYVAPPPVAGVVTDNGEAILRWREAGLREAAAIIEASQQECHDFPDLWNRHNVLLDRVEARIRSALAPSPEVTEAMVEAAIAAYEKSTPSDYRYSAIALRRALTAALHQRGASNG